MAQHYFLVCDASGDVCTLCNEAGYAPIFPTDSSIANPQFPQGLVNFNTSAQSTGQLSASTPVYIANSNLNLPASLFKGIVAGTTFQWRITMTKNGDGTGAVSVLIYMGTNGSVSDNAIVTQAFGASTAAVDTLFLDVQVTFTSTSACYWSICPSHAAVTATGFGVATGTQYSGTVTGLTTSTSQLIFGIGIEAASGGTMPTFTIQQVYAQAFNLY